MNYLSILTSDYCRRHLHQCWIFSQRICSKCLHTLFHHWNLWWFWFWLDVRMIKIFKLELTLKFSLGTFQQL